MIIFKRPENDTKWSTMTVCEIVEIVLGLEMKVHDSLLNLHQCAGGNLAGSSVNVKEDPHVI